MEKLALLGGKPVLKKPLSQYNSIGKEEKEAVLKVMDGRILSDFVGRWSEKFYGGKYVKMLEKDFCRYFKVKHAVSFNSATTALQAAVAALGIGPGDEVITTPYTMSATASAILFNNALPIFADIDGNNYCIDPKSIEKNITKKTKAILAVNLFGRSPNYKEIFAIAKKHGLKVIEDNAQAAGATYQGKYLGTLADIGVFSFNANKVIQCGEGGVLVTNNKKYAFLARLMMNHGESVINDLYKENKSFEPILGNNYRMTELQATVAVEQLKKLKSLNKKRIALANYLTQKLKKFNWLLPPAADKKSRHIYYTFAMRLFVDKIGIKRATLKKAMHQEGFIIGEGYQQPLYLFPIYQKKQIYRNSHFPFISKEFKNNISYKKGICPVAERMYGKNLFLTNICQPPQTKKEVDLFVTALDKIQNNIKELREYEKQSA